MSNDIDPNIQFPVGNGHPDEVPVGTIIVGSIAKEKTYRYELRDPVTGKYQRGPGTLRQNYPSSFGKESGAKIANRQRFRRAMAGWAALSDEEKQTYRDRAFKIRRDHRNPFDRKSWLLGHNLFVSEYEEVDELLEPQYDSGWIPINQGQTIQLTHNLAGDVEKYVVEMEGKCAADGINHECYGGAEKAGFWDHGFAWTDLTNTTIDVERAPSDIHATSVRARIWVYE